MKFLQFVLFFKVKYLNSYFSDTISDVIRCRCLITFKIKKIIEIDKRMLKQTRTVQIPVPKKTYKKNPFP